MRRLFLTANYIALIFSLFAWFYAAYIASMGGPARVTDLDRNNVFNVENLREYSPQLAENIRPNVGNWIQEPTRSTAILYAKCLAGLALLNIIGYHLLGRRARNMNAKT